MSEYDLFVQLIPCIAEIIATCRKMCRDSYGEWKEYWKKNFVNLLKQHQMQRHLWKRYLL